MKYSAAVLQCSNLPPCYCYNVTIFLLPNKSKTNASPAATAVFLIGIQKKVIKHKIKTNNAFPSNNNSTENKIKLFNIYMTHV